MKFALSAVLAAAALAVVSADCPNACSGHGQCSTEHDFCVCYEGFTGSDCSLRVCPFASAFIDLPQGDLNHNNDLNGGGSSTSGGNALGVVNGTALNPDWRATGWWERHPSQLYGVSNQIDGYGLLTKAVRAQEGHFYAECAGVGICDRSSGQCNCFPGYGGAACNRTVCPNDCSGHGVCRTISETIPAEVEWYRLWEATKVVKCVCDGGYSGLDCSQRLCPRGDDPLTTRTTRADYNKGLLETAEVQYVDVRCKYGGTAINPKIRLTYTDALTKDTYSTSVIDLSTTTNTAIATALKSLPNNVLSDYVVDGVTVSDRVTAVAFTALEASNFWRIAVTFNKAMGDVPEMGATVESGFLCKNALHVNTDLGSDQTFENVAAEVVGDGPNKKIITDVRISIEGSGAGDTMEYRLYDSDMTELTAGSWIAFTGPASAGAFVSLTGASTYDRQASLLTFAFEANDGTTALDPNDIRQQAIASTPIYRLTYDPFPVVSVKNPVATLTYGDDYWRQTVAVIESSNGTRAPVAGDPVWYDRQTGGDLAYDMKITIRNMGREAIAHDHRRAEVLINDEHVGFINGTFPNEHSGTPLFTSVASPFNYRVPSEFTSKVPQVAFNNLTATPDINIIGNSSYITFTPKTPIVVKNTGVDDIDVMFRDHEAVNTSVVLVLKIIKTSTSPDTYGWKFAGDSTWMDNNGNGYNVPAAGAFYGLHEWDTYLTSRADESRRWMASRILLRWNDGDDFDQRIPCTTGNHYYIQIGSNGLNDRPVCADRGLCDSSSGLCNCYAGYTGSDCSEQNALARGAAGRSA